MLHANHKPSRRAALLRRVSLFAGCTDDELERIDGLLTSIHVDAGETLVREGAVGRQFMIIEDGWARGSRNDLEIGRLGPGSFFGEMALMGAPHGRRGATVTALSPMVIDVLTPGEFVSLLHAAPSVQDKVAQAVVAREAMNSGVAAGAGAGPMGPRDAANNG